MNKKLIAAAVSAAVVAPVASHADAVLYGRINNAIDMNDLLAEGDGTTDISGVASRIGVRANAELDNGLGVHGHYEFSTSTDKEGTGIGDTRVATVGLSGGFGRFDVGNQWSAYNETFGTLVSPTYSLGYYLYSSVGGGLFRASNTIQYSNSFGPVTARLDVRLNDSDEGDDVAEAVSGNGIGLGLSYAVTDNITIAAAFDSEDGADGADAIAATDGSPAVAASTDFVAATPPTIDANGVVTPGTPQVGTAAVDAVDPTAAVPAEEDAPDTERIGIAVKANFGGYWATLGWQNMEVDDDENTAAMDEVDVDTMFLWGGGNFNEQTNWLIGYAEADNGTPAVAGVANDAATAGDQFVKAVRETDDATQLTWGVYHNLGGGMRIYYEGTSVEIDNTDDDDVVDGARHLLGFRVDF